MLKLGILLVLCGLVACETCNESPSCSLFSNQDRGVVSLQDLAKKVQSKLWIQIYYTDLLSKQSYGKCNFRWNAPDADENVKRELMCFNFDMNKCEDFERKVKRKTSDCNRGEENDAMNGTMDSKFYSQDLDNYFWYDTCYEYDNEKSCKLRYIDLIVSKTRLLDSDGIGLDLKGLPWHLIASDLKYHFDMEMSDVRMKFAWKGPECSFEGNVIEISSGSHHRFETVVQFAIIVLYFYLL